MMVNQEVQKSSDPMIERWWNELTLPPKQSPHPGAGDTNHWAKAKGCRRMRVPALVGKIE